MKKGDRIAQLVCEKIEYPELEETSVSLLSNSSNKMPIDESGILSRIGLSC